MPLAPTIPNPRTVLGAGNYFTPLATIRWQPFHNVIMQKTYITLSFFLFLSFLLPAQTLRVTGRVTEASTGETLIGVTVREKGGANGTATGADGAYVLQVANGEAVLVFSYTGYATQEVALNGRATLDVSLGEDLQALEQVVVVGYGTQQKSDLTGSVGTVKSKDIERIASPSVEQALQGKIAGVFVTPASGEPGAGAVVRIRGTGTLNNANPLYVIDGMIAYDAAFVNPQDVASIEVLKDASAAAIYGARGSNGVILITTKSGSKRKDASIAFNSYYGTQQVTRQLSLMNAAEFAQAYNELTNTAFFPDPAALGEGTNWQDEIFRNAPIANVQLGASGGADRYSYNISANYFKQSGVLLYSEFERVTARFNSENKLKPWLTVGNNLAFSNSKKQLPPTGAIGSAYRVSPVLSPRDSAGNFTDPTSPYGLAIANPVADLEYKSNSHEKANRFFGTVYGDVTLLKGLTFRSNFGFDLNNTQYNNYTPVFRVSNSQLNADDRLNVGMGRDRRWIWEQTLSYNRQWGNHRVNAVAGYTAEERRLEFVNASRTDFPGSAEALLYLISADRDPNQMASGGTIEEALVSQLFRANYVFLDRYMLTMTGRIDQSSRFRADTRTGTFPSFSVGWNAGQERFVERLGLFDRLKARFSWGVLGNQNSIRDEYYPSLGTIRPGLFAVFGPNETLNPGATLTEYKNPDLRWESSTQVDAGLEFGLFQGRLSGELDWYRRRTYDIIAAIPIPDYVGSDQNPVVNTAEVENVGWDILLQWRQSGPLSWNISANLSPVKNEVLRLNDQKAEIFAGGLQGESATRTVPGLPIGAFYGYKTAGIFQTQADLTQYPRFGNEQVGDLRFADIDGFDAAGKRTGLPDGKLDAADRTYLGSPIPTLTFGLSAGLEWKGFDLAADLLGVRGNKIMNAKRTFRFSVYNWEKSAFDGRWTPDNSNATQPRITNGGSNYRVSDYFVEDGDYIRLRSVTLGYSFPQQWLRRAKIGKLRLYVSGLNVWTKQKYSGYSPEFANGSNPFEVGFDNIGYPVAKSWQGGVELNF